MSTSKRPKQSGSKIAGLYDLEETIGKGHFAVVKLARHVFTGEKVAVKVIDKMKLDEQSREHLFQEVRCMKLVQHPHVVRLYEVIDTQTKLYLILELGDGGDMYDHIMKHDTGLEEGRARQYFRQIVQAIQYCHRLHVVHRDLKPENVVFFQEHGIVKLTDFGFSNKFIPGSKLETSCGTLAYSAPEILLGDSYDAPLVDVWSLGVILYMLVCGCPPFQEANDSETLTMILDCKYRLPAHLSNELKRLIERLLVREPKERATLDQIAHHEWLLEENDQPVSPPPMLPLVSQEHMTEEQNAYIIQRMVDGKIAGKEEILSSLEKDAYDHITATYYLLAERLLRKQQEAHKQSQSASTPVQALNKPQFLPLNLSPRAQSASAAHGRTLSGGGSSVIDSLVSPPPSSSSTSHQCMQAAPSSASATLRRFSLIKEDLCEHEEEEEEEDDENMDITSPPPSTSSTSATRASRPTLRQSRSVEEAQARGESTDSGDSRSSSADRSSAASSPSHGAAPISRRNAPVRPLKTVRSSPNMLNEIFEEEGESGCDDDGLNDVAGLSPPKRILQRNTVASPEVLRKYEQRGSSAGSHRSSKNHRSITAGRPQHTPGPSASSSDASDNEDSTGVTQSCRPGIRSRYHRRDSSDHSSDTDAGPSGGPTGLSGGRVLAAKQRAVPTNQDKRDKNQDNKQQQQHQQKNGKQQNGVLGKRESPSPTSSSFSMKEPTSSSFSMKDPTSSSFSMKEPLSQKISNISLTSISTLTSTASSRKYRISEPSPPQSVSSSRSARTKHLQATTTLIESMNAQNNKQVIHVRSKDFSDLMDRFTHQKDKGVKFRRRPKGNHMKVDINRNGLISPEDDGEMEEIEECKPECNHEKTVQTVNTTKCCSVI